MTPISVWYIAKHLLIRLFIPRWLVWCTKIMLPAITLTISKAWRCVEYEDGSFNVLLAG